MSKPVATPTEIRPLFIRRKNITEITGLSASTVWRLEVEEGIFPKRRKIGTGGGTVGWLYSEVEAFMNASETVNT
jgi:predicted DNA-binding transcriptional regulator AlpA